MARELDEEDRLLRLPSVEAQLAAWVVAVDRDLARRNLWLGRNGFKVYVRRSHRTLGHESLTTLDIASVTVPERLRRRGWFKQFRRLAEALNPWDATFYEAVMHPDLEQYFRQANVTPHGADSFYVRTIRG